MWSSIASGWVDKRGSPAVDRSLDQITNPPSMEQPGGGAWGNRAISRPETPLPGRALSCGFLLLDGFDLHAFAGCVEALALANLEARQSVYLWTILSLNSAGVRSRCGLRLPADRTLKAAQPFDRLIVVAPVEAALCLDPEIVPWIRRLARSGAAFGAVEGGIWPLAQAGIAAGHRVAAHWHCRTALRETFDDIEITYDRYLLDRGLATSVCGIAAFEMMVEWIRQDHGNSLADAIATRQASTTVPTLRGRPLLGLAQRLGLTNPHLISCLGVIERHVKSPLRNDELAAQVGISRRHLERLFRSHLNITPRQLYLQFRLSEAKHLIEQTQMSIAEVALTAGFVSPSHFARSFREAFGRTPKQLRLSGDLAAERRLSCMAV